MKTRPIITVVENAIVPPLSAEEYTASMERFGPFPSSLKIAVAVSGGPDSLALALCAQRWLDKKEDGSTLVAFIVDHALRPESADEAAGTERKLAKFGIDAEILSWAHAPVVSRLHEVARKARYRLLIKACRRHGIENLLFAHHREDQAETILMRMAKGSGVDGLAGMAAQKTLDGVRILRPLLDVAQERLTATCAVAGIPFVSDPSNQSQKFARGRLRRVLPLLAAEGLTVERLADLGARAAEAKAALDHAASLLVRVASTQDEAGVIRVNLEHMRSAPRAIVLRVLAMCLQSVHREDYPPQRIALVRLSDALLADANMRPCTLSGCLIGKNETHISVMREYAAITDGSVIKSGESVTWDQRWRVRLFANEVEGLELRPLGNPPHDMIDRLAPDLRFRVSQGRARAALPALWIKNRLALIPALPGSCYRANAHAKLVLCWPPVFH